MNKYLLEFEEYIGMYKPIFENLTQGNAIDIPGLYKTSGQLVLNDIYITTTKGKKFQFPVQEFVDFCKDEINVSVEVLSALRKVYQGCIIGKTSNDPTVKLSTVKEAEIYELFDVANLGFFDDLGNDLKFFGADPTDIWEIQNSLADLYDTGSTSKMSPNAVHILMEYLDTLLEFAGAKIYLFFKFIGQERLIHEPSPELNIDRTNLSKGKSNDKFLAFDAGRFATDVKTTISPKADYQSCLIDLNKMVNDACNEVGVKVMKPVDAEHEQREATSTSKYIKYLIPEINASIMTILSPVELKRLKFDGYVFFVSNDTDTQLGDFEAKPIRNVKDLIKALSKLK